MIVTAEIIVATCVLLLAVFWISHANRSHTLPPFTWHSLRSIDVAAFRNLLSTEDDEFLRASLRPESYRQVRRARVRAMQEYLSWVADNCAILLVLLRESVAGAQEAVHPQVESLARTAIQLRFTVLCLWAALWVEYTLPAIQIRPHRALRKYEELWVSAGARVKPAQSQATPAMS